MKQEILRLRLEGKSYRQIEKILGCSKATISYHCGEGQKEKLNARRKKHKTKDYLINRVYNYKSRKLRSGTRDFQRMHKGKLLNKADKYNFNVKDVLGKFGIDTICYLSGEKINLLMDDHYHLDHITPTSKNGDNTIDNLGILHKTVNKMKDNLTIDELLYWCKKILTHNGYRIVKK